MHASKHEQADVNDYIYDILSIVLTQNSAAVLARVWRLSHLRRSKLLS
jgi:hypothetical protein